MEEENNRARGDEKEPGEVDDLDCEAENIESRIAAEAAGKSEGDLVKEERLYSIENEVEKDLVDDSTVVKMNIVEEESIQVPEISGDGNSGGTGVPAENGVLTTPEDEQPCGNHSVRDKTVLGVKRARMTYIEDQPSVHVIYNSLTRASRQKLEELLQLWSEWHAEQDSSQDPSEVLENGEETFFPALKVGIEKTSAVSFWIDHQTEALQNSGLISLDSNTVPLYDRGFSLGLTLEDGSNKVEERLEIVDDVSRCFNCGAYNHSLKECPKPRDIVAVNNARKQHKSKRNQSANFRSAVRYYQETPAGKYDGLKPGTLDAETRKLLGLGELDPPPWLNRMRELGYPPGYLDTDDEDQPSGIAIYADEEARVDQEDGEIMETDVQLKKKMSVEFPGINVPIPENANKERWETGQVNSDSYRHRSQHRFNSSTDSFSRSYHHEHRWSGHLRGDWPPPGCEPGLSTSLPSSFDSRFGSHSPSPTIGRSSERVRRSPLVYEDFACQGSNHRRFSPPDHHSYSFESKMESRRYRDMDSYEGREDSYGHRNYGRR